MITRRGSGRTAFRGYRSRPPLTIERTDFLADLAPLDDFAAHKRIEVRDNGSGMSRDDALLALERHATSKIRQFDDLTRVRTLAACGG